MSGVTSTGFVALTLTEIIADLTAAFQSAFGAGIDVSATSVYGQIIGIMAERYAVLWDSNAGIYAAWSPDGAIGVGLDYLCALTGTVRNPATYSTVSCTISGTPTTPIPLGSVISVGTTGNRFSLVAGVTIGGGGTVAGLFQAISPGPVIGAAGTLTYIATPVAGWTSVTNSLDASLGSNVESDALLRLKREAELHAGGAGTVDAIRAHVLNVPLVSACQVFENVTGTTDGNGVPGHSFETLVSGIGYDVPTLRAAIWANKPAGIQAYGANSGTTPDSQGNLQTVAYSTPTEVDIYVQVNIIANVSVWNTTSGPADVLAALLAYGNLIFTNAKDVVSSALEAQCFAVAGILDVSCLTSTVNLGAATTRATIAIGTRQFAKLDSGPTRINISVSYGTP